MKYKLWVTILKDTRLLVRDRVGLLLMFVMPVLLVVVITSLQVNTFRIVNENKIRLILCTRDTGAAATQLVNAIVAMHMFDTTTATSDLEEQKIVDLMHDEGAMVTLIIPADFTVCMKENSAAVAEKALKQFGMYDPGAKKHPDGVSPILMYYHPVLQESYRRSIEGGLRSALQIVESRQVLEQLYLSVNGVKMPKGVSIDIEKNKIAITQIPVSRDGNKNIPNASQHNVPAWTLFAMFFIVSSLGSNIVKEKLSGSFTRLKTLPTSYLVAILSKQITYLGVCLAQVIVIFSLGVWFFPLIGLPKLNMPSDLAGLLLVLVICAWCAISYAMCVGVFAKTLEQANGFGAVSIVILSAIGGILVPAFAMPASFQTLMKISPLHWGLESYYGLFLEGGNLLDVLKNIVPLLGITVLLQGLTLVALRRKNLI